MDEPRALTSKEISAFVKKAKAMLTKAKRSGMPPDAVCSHFGVGESVPGFKKLSVDLSRTHNRGRLHFLFEVDGRKISSNSWKMLEDSLSRELGIPVWQGDGGHVTMSEFAPDSIRTAMDNYHSLADVFDRSPAAAARFQAFQDWWNHG